MTEEQTNEYESEMTLDIFLNWLDRPDTAGLELYPREVKEVREMILNVKDELVKQKAHIDFLQDTIATLDYKLEVYKIALDKLSLRTSVLDRTASESCVWSSKQWKEWVIESAKESMEELQKVREE